MLLLFPPAAKACEPPGGLPILGAALKAHDYKYEIIDLNYGGSNFLLDDYFSKYPKKKHNRDLLTSKDGYNNFDTYIKVLSEITRGLNSSLGPNYTLTLANFLAKDIDPLKSKDLINAAENYKDNPFYTYYKETIPEKIKPHKYVGISLQYLNQAVCSFALIGYIKDNFPDKTIVVGGGLMTSWAKSPYWENPFSQLIDKIIVGQGEIQLLEYLGISPNKDLLDNLKPDYDFTNSYKYFAPGRIIPISGSIGCSWKNCTFCPEQSEDNPFVAKKTSKIMEEISYLEKRYNPVLLHFLDNEISPSVLNAITKSDIKTQWYGFTKFYSLLEDPDFCLKLKEKGCSMLKLGLESGDQNVLNSMNKGIDLDSASIILKNLENVGIETFIYILLGTPEEDYTSAQKTTKFVIEHHTSITYLNVAIFNMPVGSDISKTQKIYNFSDADLTLYTGFEHPKGWNRKDIRVFLKKEFNSIPEIKKILNRTPPIFNANHTAFLKDER